jgi:putative redox protein
VANRPLSEDERERSERMRELALARWENEGGAAAGRRESQNRQRESQKPKGPEIHEAVVYGSAKGFAQDITTGRHRLVADEPLAVAGTDTGPGPYDLLIAALGACTSMTVSLYARRKQWPLEGVTVKLRHSKIHAADCEACERKDGMLDAIERDVELHGALTEEQRVRLLEIANKCPVHKTLTSEISIRTRLL